MALGFASLFSRAEAWRSTLYPADWKPGFTDSAGHFLHDFSYAGYHYGEAAIPDRTDNLIDATQAPYLADNTGKRDATAAIQAALDAAAKAGGGVVFLPAGTYNVAPPEGSNAALRLQGDHVVLRGAGTGKTFLYNTAIFMRQKDVILMQPAMPSYWPNRSKSESGVLTTQDLPGPATQIPVADTSPFAVGDLVVVRNDLTQRFIDQLGMTGKWTPAMSKYNWLIVAYCRRVTAVDAARKMLTVDIPLRGFLYMADRARVDKLTGHLISESGLEDFSVGMKQHPGGGLDDDGTKLETPGQPAYEIHAACAVMVNSAENCWVRRVDSYCPPGNDPKVHILSNGIALLRSREITVQDCDWKFPAFQGGGGNGYLYTLEGNDCLIRDCRAEGGRHNYDFKTMSANGNVITNCLTKNGRLASDFHMYLSMANLLDNVTCDGNFLEAHYRPYGGTPVHGVTTTQSVFWNTNGLRYEPEVGEYAGKPTHTPNFIVVSEQWGNGYVIGTRGPASAILCKNFSEGVGQGDTLAPPSLYADQLARRLAAAGK